MKKASLFLLMAIVMAGCRNNTDTVVVDNDIYYDDDMADYVSDIKSVETNDNDDLTLETAHHVVRMIGNPGTQYKYYVWTGDKDTSVTDPDIIVERGTVMVRQPD